MKKLVLSFTFLSTLSLYAYDNAHFWRPPLFIYEPRFEKKKLTTLEVSLFGGNTKTARNACAQKVPLFDIWGTQAVQNLAKNLPGLSSANTFDRILLDLAQLPSRKNFATFSTSGSFDLFEMYLDFYQNLTCGFFIHVQVPIRVISIENIIYHDLSSDDPTVYPNKNSPEWQLFLVNFKDILHHFNVSDSPIHHASAGDTTICLGWAQNYEETDYLDFIDTTIEIGGLFPSGRKKNPHLLFDIPSGYDGHWGIFTGWKGSIGLWDWVTCGAFINALFFFDKTKIKAVTTSNTSIIKLSQTSVCEKKGTLWLPGLYIKADHFMDGFSLLLGYSYAKKEKDYLQSCNTTFPNSLINKDASLKGFKLHTFHGIFSYDFAKEYRPLGPRLALFINIPLHGKRIFDLILGGAQLGFDCAWDF
jgi:hypothetical protein